MFIHNFIFVALFIFKIIFSLLKFDKPKDAFFYFLYKHYDIIYSESEPQ